MAYRVAQLRKNNNTTYMQEITKNFITVKSENFFAGNIQELEDLGDFTDLAISSSGNSSDINTGFRDDQVYYLDFSIRRIPKDFYSGDTLQGQKKIDYESADYLDITLLLKHSSNQDKQQQIGTLRVPIGTVTKTNFAEEIQYTNFSFVFSPNDSYDRLVFKVQRDRYDILQKERNWMLLDLDNLSDIILSSDEQDIKNNLNGNSIFVCNNLARLIDLLPASRSAEWLKFGYQGRPGSLIVVNNEPIRVGRSGIYEFNNGLKVTNFMLAGSTIDAFLLDYAYNG